MGSLLNLHPSLIFEEQPRYVLEKHWQPQAIGFLYALTAMFCKTVDDAFTLSELDAVLARFRFE